VKAGQEKFTGSRFDDLLDCLFVRKREDEWRTAGEDKTEQDKKIETKFREGIEMSSIDGLGRRLLNERDTEDLVEVCINSIQLCTPDI